MCWGCVPRNVAIREANQSFGTLVRPVFMGRVRLGFLSPVVSGQMCVRPARKAEMCCCAGGFASGLPGGFG